MSMRVFAAHTKGVRRLSLSFGVATWLLAGCGLFQSPPAQPEPTSADEAGNVYVSAYPAVAWEDIAEQLEPKHNITIEQARQMAIQATQSQQQQFLSVLSAGLALGLPNRSITQTASVATDGTSSTTGTRTTGSGDVPPSSGAASTAIADAALAADLSKGPMAFPSDANTLLYATHALYQQAKVLDNQISKAVVPRGYRAHLVTLQVNLQPRRRDYAYDAYVNVSLMPGSWKEALETSTQFDEVNEPDFPALIFYPLVITDALETASASKSIEIVRQLTMSLSGLVGRVGANLGVNSGSDSLDQLIGTDKNSLITLGRVNNSTLRIRIGAQHAGSNKFAMVPRTYNVSLVVLTRYSAQKETDRVQSLSVITRTELVSSLTGKELVTGPSRSRQELAKDVTNIVMEVYKMTIADTCGTGPSLAVRKLEETFEVSGKTFKMQPALDLLRATGRGDYAEVSRCLNVPDTIAPRSELTLRRLISDLLDVQTTSKHSTLQVALQQLDSPTLPPNEQLVIAKDDKSGLSALLKAGAGLAAPSLQAELQFKSSVGGHLLPNTLTVASGKDLTVVFPSLASLGLSPSDLDERPLKVFFKGHAKKQEYKLRFVSEEKQTPGNPVKINSVVVVSDPAGNGLLTVSIGKLPTGVKGKLRLVVSGADLREGKSLGSSAPTNRGLDVVPESVVTLALSNLSPAKVISVATYADDTKLGGDLTVPVERTSAEK